MPTDLENLITHAIPREVAKRKFRNWIDYATAKLNFSPAEVPKSILIPIVDIHNLMKAFKMFGGNREISGVRVYLIRDEPYETHPDGLFLKCMVVPTVKSGKVHEDAIVTIPPLKQTGEGGNAARMKATEGEDSGGTETIYDFTTSCPPDCDGTVEWK
jgi:hypothetical protein